MPTDSTSTAVVGADDLAFADGFEMQAVEGVGMGSHDRELALESPPGSLPERQQRGLPGHGRTARRWPRGLGIPDPRDRQMGSPSAAIA